MSSDLSNMTSGFDIQGRNSRSNDVDTVALSRTVKMYDLVSHSLYGELSISHYIFLMTSGRP